MEQKIERPETYPDSNARGNTRDLSNLLREKYLYYGGNMPNPPPEPAAAITQTKFQSTVVSGLVTLKPEGEVTAVTLFQDAAKVMANIYTLNPHVLAAALYIHHRIGLEKPKDLNRSDFKVEFDRAYDHVRSFLYEQLSKIQHKGKISKKISDEGVKSDLYRYIMTYLIYSEKRLSQ